MFVLLFSLHVYHVYSVFMYIREKSTLKKWGPTTFALWSLHCHPYQLLNSIANLLVTETIFA